jgi:hypothetical protein
LNHFIRFKNGLLVGRRERLCVLARELARQHVLLVARIGRVEIEALQFSLSRRNVAVDVPNAETARRRLLRMGRNPLCFSDLFGRLSGVLLLQAKLLLLEQCF